MNTLHAPKVYLLLKWSFVNDFHTEGEERKQCHSNGGKWVVRGLVKLLTTSASICLQLWVGS